MVADKRRGLIYSISSPSGAGKTSLIKALLAQLPQLEVAVSHTTRPKRPAEVDGKHYHFLTVDEFKAQQEAGDFIESAEVFGHYYGTSIHAIEKPLKAGHDVLLDIDWQGANSIKSIYHDMAIGIFILPPSREDLLKRLQGRGQDSEEVIDHRMQNAKNEIQHYTEYDYLVVNADFDKALDELISILTTYRLRRQWQAQEQHDLLAELLA